jgi:hypothetical protein
MNWYFILAKRSTTFEEPVKGGDKKSTSAKDLPQGHRAQENFHLPEEISQEIRCFRYQQTVFDHCPLNSRDIGSTLSSMNYPAASYGVSNKNVMPVKTGIHLGFPLSRE